MAELPVNTGATAMDMANEMFGAGIQVVSATYTGDPAASGIYTNGDTIAPGATPSDSGVILSTGNASSYTNATGDVNAATNTTTNTTGVDGNALLDSVAGQATFDGAILETSFIPTGDTLTMQFTFSSEEYLEYVNSGFNDAIAVFVNGVKVPLSVGTGDVSINTINNVTNQNLFIDNQTDAFNTEMDGLTVTLTMKAPVNSGDVNTLLIGIADGGDSSYDSNLLIAGDSVQSVTIAGDDAITMATGATRTIDVLANDNTVNGALTITHINGQPAIVGTPITLPSGEIVTLTPDGKLQVVGDGNTGAESFTYTVEDSAGNSDIGFVTVTESAVPCFVSGTPIDTPYGTVAVEDLRPGMAVMTPKGPKVLRWVGTVTTVARGRHAPVVFERGAIGNTAPLSLSPNHRIRMVMADAALMFGNDAVLVAAKDLVNGQTIRRDCSASPVTYVHLLFDRHELVRAAGVWSESFHPGETIIDRLAEDTQAEIFALFPQLAQRRDAYGPTALPVLRSFEAQAMLQSRSRGVRATR